MHFDYGWGMGFGWFFMMAFWLLVILGVIYLISSLLGKGKNTKKSENTLEILNQRYARGDISRAEYIEKKNDLQ
ncbi:MAG: SHOCT domain-containing protein [Nitrospira sp.]|nr:SHOCT domain-containing protein [bacterium]MBL7049032.1 SHOCT domain-containing protein [Nitrospira sp.]